VSTPFLSFDGVIAGYGGGDVLKGVNFGVESGGVTSIVGPNGCGKSTLLKTVSGLLKPRLGSITFKGESLVGKTPKAILQMGIVQVPQNHSLFREMTVRQNVELGAFLIKNKAVVAARYEKVCELFPVVSERAADRAGALSGGQQRLVEFARCLMLEPELVLLDEPSMGLDPKTLRAMFATIKTMNAEGRTVLLVEQNARQALKMSHQGIVLENGVVRLSGSGIDVLNNPEIAALYLGGSITHH
jgi:branched-chain amino acid transport system ATP-binding protein